MILFLTSLYNDRRVGRIGVAELKNENEKLRIACLGSFSILNFQFLILWPSCPSGPGRLVVGAKYYSVCVAYVTCAPCGAC